MHGVLVGLLIAALAIALVPIVAYVWPGHPAWVDPYESTRARWAVYLGGGLALVLFIALSRS